MDPELIPSASPEPPLLQPALPAAQGVGQGVYWSLGALLAATVLGFFVRGELRYFLMASWQVAPFAVLCVLAYVGLSRQVARVGAWLLLVVVLGVLGLVNAVLTLWALHGVDEKNILPSSLPDGTILRLAWVAGLSGVAAATMLLPLSPAWRRLCGRLTGNGDWTGVRTLALAVVSSLTLACCVPLLVLGESPLLLMVRQSSNAADLFGAGRGAVGMNLDALYSLCWTLVAAGLAVGYGVRRNWAETLERLGLRRVSKRQVGFALGLTALLLGAMYGVDLGITRIWQAMNWPITDAAAFTALMAPLLTPIGAVVIGVTAGVGEEVAVRGILQPRLGIFLSNAFFTSLHAFQYGWDALVSVFLIGLILGVIRRKTSTTVSAVVHGSYDFVLVLLESFSRST